MARPKKEIDPILVRKLAAIHCTTREIAAVLDCNEATLNRRFASELAKGREQGKTKLRQGLWDLASKGNLGALIWLSKQHLGMSDKVEETSTQTIKSHVTYDTSGGDGKSLDSE